METQVRKSRYAPLLIGGIAALMAWRPASTGDSADAIVLHDYEHGNPWPVLGIAVAASAVIGFLAAKRRFFDPGRDDS